MGVYIKGMKIPQSCTNCPIRAYDMNDQKFCGATGNNVRMGLFRPDDCPLIPVPPHGDLIDKQVADELNKKDYEEIGSDRYTDYARSVVQNCLNAAPIVIPADHIGDANEMVKAEEGE